MSWIKTIGYSQAKTPLKKIYDRIKGPNGTLDNVLTIHSLRPHSLVGHMTLYKAVLHNNNNTLPKWYLEALGVYVSHLNQCDYCVAHHLEGLRRLLRDDRKTDLFFEAVRTDTTATFFESRYQLGIRYAKKLTLSAHKIEAVDVAALKEGQFSDGEILEINQVVSYFNYVNRSVLGLGVSTTGDVLGLSPSNSNNPDNWEHL